MAVLIVARARMPGARKSIGSFVSVGKHVDQAEEHEQQHWDAERQQQLLAVAGDPTQLGPQLHEQHLHG